MVRNGFEKAKPILVKIFNYIFYSNYDRVFLVSNNILSDWNRLIDPTIMDKKDVKYDSPLHKRERFLEFDARSLSLMIEYYFLNLHGRRRSLRNITGNPLKLLTEAIFSSFGKPTISEESAVHLFRGLSEEERRVLEEYILSAHNEIKVVKLFQSLYKARKKTLS